MNMYSRIKEESNINTPLTHIAEYYPSEEEAIIASKQYKENGTFKEIVPNGNEYELWVYNEAPVRKSFKKNSIFKESDVTNWKELVNGLSTCKTSNDIEELMTSTMSSSDWSKYCDIYYEIDDSSFTVSDAKSQLKKLAKDNLPVAPKVDPIDKATEAITKVCNENNIKFTTEPTTGFDGSEGVSFTVNDVVYDFFPRQRIDGEIYPAEVVIDGEGGLITGSNDSVIKKMITEIKKELNIK